MGRVKLCQSLCSLALTRRLGDHAGAVNSDFTHTDLPKVQKPVYRMGLAGNYGVNSDDVVWAADQGVNYWLYGASFRKVTVGLKSVIKRDRDRHVVAFLGMGGFAWQVRRSVEGALKRLETDYLDVFKLGWLGKTSRYSPGILEELAKLKDEGKIRTIGTSIHDRARAGRLAEDSPIDVFMIRYNAKHPGAERDIFPHLEARNPAVVAYTALAWQQLTRPVKGIEMPPFPGPIAGPPPLTPALCYRFVLSDPHVHVAITGPKDRAQLAQNLGAMAQGPLSEAEMAWVRDYGRQLKAKKKLDYIP